LVTGPTAQSLTFRSRIFLLHHYSLRSSQARFLLSLSLLSEKEDLRVGPICTGLPLSTQTDEPSRPERFFWQLSPSLRPSGHVFGGEPASPELTQCPLLSLVLAVVPSVGLNVSPGSAKETALLSSLLRTFNHRVGLEPRHRDHTPPPPPPPPPHTPHTPTPTPPPPPPIGFLPLDCYQVQDRVPSYFHPR